MPGILEIYQNAIVTSNQSPAWTGDSNLTVVEHTEDVNVVFKGISASSIAVPGDYQTQTLTNVVSYTSGSVKLKADGTQPPFSFWFI